MSITRNGKIARLPKTIRDELNRRLSDGEPGKDLVEWLNALPEVQKVVSAEFGGRRVREQNLSEWKQGGHRDWEQQQAALELVRSLSADADELKAASAEGLSDKLGVWLAGRYAVATQMLASAEGGKMDWQRLRELCEDVVALRRGDHSAARLKVEQARLEREREKTEDELVGHFERWAKNPKVRESICNKCVSPEERERRMREAFGLAPKDATGSEQGPGASSAGTPS
jgi:hypothetical protein